MCIKALIRGVLPRPNIPHVVQSVVYWPIKGNGSTDACVIQVSELAAAHRICHRNGGYRWYSMTAAGVSHLPLRAGGDQSSGSWKLGRVFLPLIRGL